MMTGESVSLPASKHPSKLKSDTESFSTVAHSQNLLQDAAHGAHVCTVCVSFFGMDKIMSLRRFSTLFALVFLTSFACADSGEYPTTQNDAAEEENQNQENAGEQNTDEPIVIDDNYYLEAVGATSYDVAADSTVSLSVRLTHGETGPVSNQPIQYQVVESTGDSAVGFGASTVLSNEDGETSNGVRVGAQSGEIVVEVSHAEVEDPVEFDIGVTGVDNGDMRVGLDYDEHHLQELSDIEIRYWKTNRIACANISPLSLPAEPFIEEDVVPDTTGEVLYEDLAPTETYTVTATGHGPQDQISAVGCIDDIPVQSNEVTDAVVPLSLVPLRPMGTYDVTSYWDFSEALAASGPVGEAVLDAINWIANPADAAAEYMVDLAITWICDTYGWGSSECIGAQGARSWAEDEVSDFIEDQIEDIEVLDDFQTMGEDLLETIENMKVDSLLTVTNRAIGEGELRGLDIWQVVYFYWTQDCDANSPPDCGEIEIDLGSDTDYGILRGNWQGRLYDYDQLEIDPHAMVIPYGKFINYLLSEHLIPSLTNGQADNLSDAFEYMLCDNIDDFDFWGYTFDASAYCSLAFDAIGDLVEFYIDTLEYDVNLNISGHGHMIDLESDAVVDVIEDGYFHGELEAEDGSVSEMEADFTAVRQN